jgi:hypothetical protein
VTLQDSDARRADPAANVAERYAHIRDLPGLEEAPAEARRLLIGALFSNECGFNSTALFSLSIAS